MTIMFKKEKNKTKHKISYWFKCYVHLSHSYLTDIYILSEKQEGQDSPVSLTWRSDKF